ncbi:MAG: hypothetical protein LAP61_04000 [Acidobacteriia bacterium]|nr:hypothetical protein [Terriglobia bacterium]
MKILRIGCVAMLMSIPALRSGAANLPSQVEGHRSGLTARVTSADGTSRSIKLEGVGCTESMCSRVFIRSKSANGVPLQIWLDSVASIKDSTDRDAVFVMKNGTEQRLAYVTDFRVLYVSNRVGRTEKLDLGKIRSLEFVDSVK